MKIGILGMGSIGQRHAKNLNDLGHEVLIHDITFDSVREHVIKEADAMVIATPTRCHFADLRDCLDAGKPTFVEKPIAANRQEYDELFDRLVAHDVFVGYNARFHPCVIRIKEWLDDGVIGPPLWGSFVCAQYNAKPAYRRDGVILNWSHEIDLARHLLGPSEVFGAVVHIENNLDDMADLFLVHGGKVRSAVHLNYLTSPQARGFQIIGMAGVISANLADGFVERQGERRPIGQRTYFAPDAWDNSYIQEMWAFLDHVEGKPAAGAHGNDGLAVLDLALAARRMAGLP